MWTDIADRRYSMELATFSARSRGLCHEKGHSIQLSRRREALDCWPLKSFLHYFTHIASYRCTYLLYDPSMRRSTLSRCNE